MPLKNGAKERISRLSSIIIPIMSILKRISGNARQQELGFGSSVRLEGRLMNPNGSFNVERQRMSM